MDELYKGKCASRKSGPMKFNNFQKIEGFPISKRKLNNSQPGVEYHWTPRKNEGHWVNPMKMEFGWAPLGESETSDFSGLKASNKGKNNLAMKRGT